MNQLLMIVLIFIFIERGLCTYIWETTIESIINSFSIINQGSNDSEDENSTPLSTVDPYVYFILYIEFNVIIIKFN